MPPQGAGASAKCLRWARVAVRQRGNGQPQINVSTSSPRHHLFIYDSRRWSTALPGMGWPAMGPSTVAQGDWAAAGRFSAPARTQHSGLQHQTQPWAPPPRYPLTPQPAPPPLLMRLAQPASKPASPTHTAHQAAAPQHARPTPPADDAPPAALRRGIAQHAGQVGLPVGLRAHHARLPHEIPQPEVEPAVGWQAVAAGAPRLLQPSGRQAGGRVLVRKCSALGSWAGCREAGSGQWEGGPSLSRAAWCAVLQGQQCAERRHVAAGGQLCTACRACLHLLTAAC